MPNASDSAAATGLPEKTALEYTSSRQYRTIGSSEAVIIALGALVAPRANTTATSPDLELLIEMHRRARKATGDAFDLAGDDATERLRLGISIGEAEQRYDAASDAEMAAIYAVRDYHCRTLEDVRAWAQCLNENESLLDDGDYEAALLALALPFAEAEARA